MHAARELDDMSTDHEVLSEMDGRIEAARDGYERAVRDAADTRDQLIRDARRWADRLIAANDAERRGVHARSA